MLSTKVKIAALSASYLFSITGYANNCEQVNFADVGWTDITATTAVASELLHGLGYKTHIEHLSVPATYASMAKGDIDVFLGNWMPTMEADIREYRQSGSVEIVRANLTGAKYTLAVPRYVYQAGVTQFSDIAKFADKFSYKIYGIEPGNDGNRLIQSMIDTDAFGLKDFSIIESSESGLIAQVSHAISQHQWISFLGWAPHPMNSNFDMVYLSGGDDYFGPDFGGANVYTNVRQGYQQECANVSQLMANLAFSLEMENQLMDAILNQNQNPAEAAKNWLKNNSPILDKWLADVTTQDGKPATPAVIEYLTH